MKAIMTVSLSETTIAILAGNTSGARWEVYTVDSDGLESFSHYATAGESRQLSALAYGAELTTFAARRAGDAKHFGLFA